MKGVKWPTLVDIAKRTNPDGSIASPAEILAETNEIMQDFPVLEANMPLGHRETARTGLPEVFWRRFNKGVQSSKSRTQQMTDTLGMMEARSQIDAKLAELNGNSAAWRMTEEKPFLEAMGQKIAKTIFYGNEKVDTDEFTGLAARYSTLDAATPISKNVIDAGGTTGNLTSIWLICWNDDTLNMRYPKGLGSNGNPITAEDLGKQEVDVDGGRMTALETKYTAELGLSVKDWRYAVRIANIPVDALGEDGSGADLWNLLIKAQHRLPMLTKGRCYFYMNRDVKEYLDLQSFNKPNVRRTARS